MLNSRLVLQGEYKNSVNVFLFLVNDQRDTQIPFYVFIFYF